MRALRELFGTIGEAVSSLPADVMNWAETVDDRTFLMIMVSGLLVLGFVLGRALR